MKSVVLRGPRKVILATEYCHDPAIESGVDAYIESHYDVDKLVLRDDIKPTYWYLTPLTRRQDLRRVGIDFDERINWTLRCGLVSVADYQVDLYGDIVEPLVERKQEGLYGELTTQASLDGLELSAGAMVALAAMIDRLTLPLDPLSRRLPTAQSPDAAVMVK